MAGQNIGSEQEIKLRDYIEVIIKRKKLILTVFFMSLIAAAAMSLTMPKVYMASAIIQNGYIGDPVIKMAETANLIESQAALEPIIKELDPIATVGAFRMCIKVIGISDTNFFELRVTYKGEDTAKKICQRIVDSYMAFSEPIYRERIKLIDEQLVEIEKQVQVVQNDIDFLRKVLSPISLSPDEAMASGPKIIFLQETLSGCENNLMSLINIKANLNMTRNKAREFKIIDPPIRTDRPISPRVRFNIAISGILGLMVGMFLVFFMEYWEKTK